ncbi:MAG TPA: hypothetical protein VLM18_06655 [Croceibacterium sp.]|nr:hypothetical protein [Croceibacterium sp.]
MKHQKHTHWTATAAIAAALALSATPLAAQSIDTPVPAAPTIQTSPAPPVAASPAPTVVVPDVAPAPTVSSDQPAPEASTPAATRASDTVAPVARTTHTTRTAVTHATTVSHAAPMAAVAPAVAVTPPPANDVASLPAQSVDSTTTTAIAPPPPPAEPTPAQTNNVIGTLGLVLLGLLALAILAAGLLFLRRRHPLVTDTLEDPLVTRPVVEKPVAEPVAAAMPMAASTMIRRRDMNPVAGALPSDGAAVDLPTKLPETHEERTALFERMVDARPDKANPFTDRHARMRRARLIMQSLGVTFDREPRIDLSQYPNNWPELQRQYHKAA